MGAGPASRTVSMAGEEMKTDNRASLRPKTDVILGDGEEIVQLDFSKCISLFQLDGRGYQKRCPLENKSQKCKEIIIKPLTFMRNLPYHFTAVQCRSALRQWCLIPKEMKGLSTQGSGIDKNTAD